MQIEEAKKILKGMFYNDNGEKMHYIDFSDSYGDEWGGYTLPEYIEAIETVLNELEKKDNKIKELEGRCRNLDKEAQSYLEELMGDSTLKNRTIKQLNLELEKKEAEIDKLRNSNKDLLRKLRNRVKEVKKLTRYSLYKKEFARLNKQLKKKDRVIDLLADDLRYYEGMQQDQLFCIDTCEGKMCDEEHCKERIKEYFYKKIEEK